jgi:hypothetical protein
MPVHHLDGRGLREDEKACDSLKAFSLIYPLYFI